MSSPKLSRQDVESLLRAKGVTDKVALVGIRGYYLDSMGKRGANDRGMYDDAIFVVSPRRFAAFRANTDPSIYRAGIATLKTGVHRYYKGKHKGLYWALRLVGEQAPVMRDGQTGTKTGIALNIHKGGNRSTGSLGCQTLMPSDWDEFIEMVYDEMDAYGQKQVPYLLVDEVERRRGIQVSAADPAVKQGTEKPNQNKLPSAVGASSIPFAPPQARQPDSPYSPAINITDADEVNIEGVPGQLTAFQIPPINEIFEKAQAAASAFEKAKEMVEQAGKVIPGMRATDPAIKVTSGKSTAFWLNIFGIVVSALAAAWGFLKENAQAIGIGILGIIVFAVTIAATFTVINYFKMKYFSDPTKYNVE
jgi:hypothetical protein